MKMGLPFGKKRCSIKIDLPEDKVIILTSKQTPGFKDWGSVVEEGLASPIAAKPIRENNLRSKRVVILTDDRARPTPTWQMLPPVLNEVHAAGATVSDITIMTAGGLHDPMTEEEIAKKVGKEIAERYHCIAHNSDLREQHIFYGLTPRGIPVWIDKAVAEADYKIAVGRINLHESYGYEGGYKMILPGVSGFETVAAHHSLNFLPGCMRGTTDSITRIEAELAGEMVGLDFLVNVVPNAAGEAVKAFCGHPITAHRHGVAFGDHEVWGAGIKNQADITIASPGSGKARTSGYSEGTLVKAAYITKESGWIIMVTPQDMILDEPLGENLADEKFCRLELDEFKDGLYNLAVSEMVYLHQKRDWQFDLRGVQRRLRATRLEFQRKIRLLEIGKRKTILTTNPQKALEETITKFTSANPLIAIIPEGKTTFPKKELFSV